MRKVALLGVVGTIATLVACAASPDEGAAASAADTTNTPTTTTTGTAGRTTTGTRGTVATNVDASTPVTPATDAGPTTCYSGQGSCDPTNPNACGPGATCDVDGQSHAFTCFPPPNDAQLGAACNNGQGPFCAAGLACSAGTCKTYCCDDSVCAAGTTCQATGTDGTITIKVCQ